MRAVLFGSPLYREVILSSEFSFVDDRSVSLRGNCVLQRRQRNCGGGHVDVFDRNALPDIDLNHYAYSLPGVPFKFAYTGDGGDMT